MIDSESVQAEANAFADRAIELLTPCFSSNNPPTWTHRRTIARNGSVTQINLEAELLSSYFDHNAILSLLNWSERVEGDRSLEVSGSTPDVRVVVTLTWHESRPK